MPCEPIVRRLPHFTMILLIAANISMAIDFSSGCRQGGNARRAAQQLAAVLPHSGKPLVVYSLSESFGVDSGRLRYLDVRVHFVMLTGGDMVMALLREFFLGREWTTEPEWESTYVIDWHSGRFRLRNDIKAALQQKMDNYGTPPQPELSYSVGESPQPGEPVLIARQDCPAGPCIELSGLDLDPILYDRVSVSLRRPVACRGKWLVLQWSEADSNTTPSGRSRLLITGSQLVFNLRAEPSWLTARTIETLWLILDGQRHPPDVDRLSIDREPFVHVVPEVIPPILIDTERLRRSGAMKKGGPH